MLLTGFLGNHRQAGSALCDDFIRQRHRITGTGHTAVEVNLFEPGGNISADQLIGFCHGFFSRFILPAVRSEVVAAEDQVFAGKVMFIGQFPHKITEICRGHAGITTELIHLIGGCFNQ